MAASLLVIYDGQCRFCRFGIGVIDRLDKRGVFDFCPFGHPVAEEKLSKVPQDARYESMHVVDKDLVHSATDAARVMLRELPLGRLGVAFGLHRAYAVLARYRWLLGRISPHRAALVTCGDSLEPTLS